MKHYEELTKLVAGELESRATLTPARISTILLSDDNARGKLGGNVDPRTEFTAEGSRYPADIALHILVALNQAGFQIVKTRGAASHVKVLHGLCNVCGHYGSDCTGKAPAPAGTGDRIRAKKGGR